VVNQGQNKATVIRRAHHVLKSEEGKSDRASSELRYIHEDRVRNTRKRFVEAGLQAGLEDNAKPKPEPKLNEQQQAYLVAVACSQPPTGHARWTLDLWAAQLVNDGIVAGISPEAVRLALKKHPEAGAGQEVVYSQDHPSVLVPDGACADAVRPPLRPVVSGHVLR
jgi:transposase